MVQTWRVAGVGFGAVEGPGGPSSFFEPERFVIRTVHCETVCFVLGDLPVSSR